MSDVKDDIRRSILLQGVALALFLGVIGAACDRDSAVSDDAVDPPVQEDLAAADPSPVAEPAPGADAAAGEQPPAEDAAVGEGAGDGAPDAGNEEAGANVEAGAVDEKAAEDVLYEIDSAPWELHSNEAGRYAIRVPPQFRVARFPGLEFPILGGPDIDGFSPNLVFIIEDVPAEVGLGAYAMASRSNLLRAFPHAQVGEMERFTAHDGGSFIRLVSTVRQMEFDLRQTFFVYLKEGRAMTITASAPVAVADDWDAVFFEAARTFSW